MSKRNNSRAKEINFYLKYSYDPAAEAKKKTIRNLVLPIACLLLALVIAVGVIMVPAFLKNTKVKEYEDYINNPTTVQRYEDAKRVIKERDKQQEIHTELSDLRVILATMPTAGSAFMNTMRECVSLADATGYSFESGNKFFVINLKTETVSALPTIVSNLRQTGEFSDVKYSGYKGSEKEYTTTITCIYR